jgi:N-acetylglucosamine-6-phosphate deacetylase
MPDGEYCLGGQKVLKKGEFATLEDGTLAGSVSNLYECMKKAVFEMQIPLEHAILACTKTPAKSLGVDDKCGILEEGRKADILILDKNLEIKYVIKNGKWLEVEIKS